MKTLVTRRRRADRGRRRHRGAAIASAASSAAVAVASVGAALVSPARGVVLYESGELGAIGQITGATLSADTMVGVRFQLASQSMADRMGGHFGSVFPPSATLFGALVQLSGPGDFPDSNDLSSADVLKTTVLTASYGSNDLIETFSPVVLPAGWYALVFGSGRFGAAGTGVAPQNNPQYGTPAYFFRFDNNPWTNSATSGYRFVVAGPSAKFWASAASGDWHNPSSWSPSGVPQSFDDVLFTLGGAYTVNFAQNGIAHDIKNHFSNVTLALGGKTLTTTGRIVVGSDAIGGAVLNIQNGIVSQPGDEIIVGEIGSGSMNVSNLGHISGYAATEVIVGKQNAGQLTLANNGQIYSAVARVADDQSVSEGIITGSATVWLGNVGEWQVRDSFYAGRNGPAVVNIGVDGEIGVGNTVKIFDSVGTELLLQGGLLRTGNLDTSGNPSRFNWSSGTLQTTNALTIGPLGPLGASLTVGSGRTWECDGGANVAAGADLDVAAGGTVFGPVTNDGTITQTGGSLHVTGSNGLTGSGTMNVSAGTLAARQIRQQAITIDGSGLVKLHVSGATGPSTSVTESLNISGAGKLDLTDKKLVVAAGAGAIGSWNGSAYTGITGMIQSGRGNGSWNGSGIVTSDTRAVGNNDLCSIGVASASQIKNIASTATAPWAGQTVLGTDVLVMFTWGGDANLDGKINIDDYGRIDGNVASSGSVFGWFNGDFNYDGKINIDDYGIIDGNINRQGAPFSTTSLDIAAVPEPAAGVVALAGLSVRHVGRRRRRRE